MSSTKPEVSILMGQSQHLDEIDAIYNHYIIHTAATFDIDPWPRNKREQWLSQYNHNNRHFLFVAVDTTGQCLGYCTSSTLKDKAAYDKSVEVSIYLKPDQQHQGLGSSLYSHLLATLKQQGIHRAYALITVPNPNSEKFHKKYGFELVSQLNEVGYKFNQYYDTRWYQLKVDQLSLDLLQQRKN